VLRGSSRTTSWPPCGPASPEPQEAPPSSVGDRPGEMPVADHVGDPQVFDADPVEPAGQRPGLLVLPVPTLVGGVRLHLRPGRLRLDPVLGALRLRARLRCERASALAAARANAGWAHPRRVLGGGEGAQPDIDAGALPGQPDRVGLDPHDETGPPAAGGVAVDGHRLGGRRQRPGPHHPQTGPAAGHRHRQPATVEREPVAVPRRGGVRRLLPFEPGPPARVALVVERPDRLVEVAQHLLLGVTGTAASQSNRERQSVNSAAIGHIPSDTCSWRHRSDHRPSAVFHTNRHESNTSGTTGPGPG
jgi:hypothetical protein